MKLPYTAKGLNRVFTRIFPTKKIELGYDTVQHLRNAAIEDFVGNLVATHYERAIIQSAMLDSRNSGYLKFAREDDAEAAEAAFANNGELLGHDVHIHFSKMAEIAYAYLHEAEGLPLASGVYAASVGGANGREVTIYKQFLTDLPETGCRSSTFEARFFGDTGLLVGATFEPDVSEDEWAATRMKCVRYDVPQAVLDKANDWGAVRRPAARKAA